jgi:hypothetical protein
MSPDSGGFRWDTCGVNGLAAAVLMLALMALASAVAIRYFRQLREGSSRPGDQSGLTDRDAPGRAAPARAQTRRETRLFVDQDG